MTLLVWNDECNLATAKLLRLCILSLVSSMKLKSCAENAFCQISSGPKANVYICYWSCRLLVLSTRLIGPHSVSCKNILIWLLLHSDDPTFQYSQLFVKVRPPAHTLNDWLQPLLKIFESAFPYDSLAQWLLETSPDDVNEELDKWGLAFQDYFEKKRTSPNPESVKYTVRQGQKNVSVRNLHCFKPDRNSTLDIIRVLRP